MIVGTIGLVILNTGLFIIGVLVWENIWYKRYGVQIPVKREVREQFDTPEDSMEILRGSLRKLIDSFGPILYNLDASYWIQVCGFEAYTYLYFQRAMLRLFLIYSFIAVVASIPLNFATQMEEGFFTRTTMPQQMSNLTAWFQVAIIFIYSAGVFITVHFVRVHIGELLQSRQHEESNVTDHEWIKGRSIHVRGLDTGDRSGIAIAHVLNDYLRTRKGKVLDVQILPDYQSMLALEVKRADADLLRRLSEIDPSITETLCFGGGRTVEHFDAEIAELEVKIQEETQKPYNNSGHAMVALNSLASVEKCIYEFGANMGSAARFAFGNILEKVREMRRQRSFSATFERFQDDPSSQHSDIFVSKCVEPFDINWLNVGGTRGVYLFRRVLVQVLAVLVLLFLTTPAMLLTTLKSVDFLSIFDMSWTINLPEPFDKLFEAYMTSLAIVLLNQVLLLLIDFSSYMERHYSYSLCQISILNKAALYLTLNMLVIPAVTLATAHSFMKILNDKDFLLADILGEIHLADSGSIFVNLLLQKACFSSIFYLVRGNEISANYGSVALAHYIREDLNAKDKWRRKDIQIFQYGYFYALMIAATAIVMTFCSTVPLVIIAGGWFFMIKHCVDGYNLFFVHKQELDSTGGLIKSVTSYILICILFYQISMIGFFALSESKTQCFVLFMFFMISILLCFWYSGPLYDPAKVDEELFTSIVRPGEFINSEMNPDTAGVNQVVSERGLNNWRDLWAHPLAITQHLPSNAVTPRVSQWNEAPPNLNEP